jgi:hypothetical protein
MALPTNPPPPALPIGPAANDFARFRPEKTIEQLMVEQGIAGPQDVDALFGSGADLWDSDAEFEQFLDWLRESRREER